MYPCLMRMLVVGLLILGFGGQGGAGDKDDAIKADLKFLEGAWQMKSFEINGKPAEPEQIKQVKLAIQGNKYLVDLGDNRFELTFTIDPTKKPKTIDFVQMQDGEKAITHGIYEVSKDTLRICRTSEAGKDRPTDFSTKAGSGRAVATYQRSKKS